MGPRQPANNATQPRLSPSKVERALEKACSDLIAYDGWIALKTDPQSERGFVKRVMAKLEKHPTLYRGFDEIRSVLASCTRDGGFGEPGMADVQYRRYTYGELDEHGLRFDRPASTPECRALTQLMWIEWKRPGEKLKDHQKLWHRDEEIRGGLTVKAGVDFEASIEGFLTWYRSSGLMRRKL